MGKDWGGYRAIIDEGREIAKKEREAPVVECPNDGSTLQVRNGVANCPMGDYRVTVSSRET